MNGIRQRTVTIDVNRSVIKDEQPLFLVRVQWSFKLLAHLSQGRPVRVNVLSRGSSLCLRHRRIRGRWRATHLLHQVSSSMNLMMKTIHRYIMSHRVFPSERLLQLGQCLTALAATRWVLVQLLPSVPKHAMCCAV